MSNSSVSYGASILPASDMKDILREQSVQQSGVQYWKQALGEVGQRYSQSATAATADYSEAIAKAYAANLKNREAIDKAAMSTGGAAQASALNRQTLLSTYQNYLSNYVSRLSEATQTYAANKETIDTALTEEAEDYRSIYSSVYDYLKNELSNLTTGTGDTATGYLAGKGLDWLYNKDESGNITGVREWSDILGNELTDDKGQLTDAGQQFFDAMLNAQTEGYTYTDDEGNVRKARGFDEYLSETNPELREWWASADQTNYNNLGTGTKGASVRQKLGIDYTPYSSRDLVYEKNQEKVLSVVNSNVDIDTISKSVDETIVKLKEAQTAYDKVYEQAKEVEARNPRRNASAYANLTNEGKTLSQVKAAMINRSNEINKATETLATDMKASLSSELYDAWYSENKDLIEYASMVSTKQISNTKLSLMAKKLKTLVSNTQKFIKAAGNK